MDEGPDGMRGAAHHVEVDGLSEVGRCRPLAASVLGGWLGQGETQQQGYGTGPQRSALEAHRGCGGAKRGDGSEMDRTTRVQCWGGRHLMARECDASEKKEDAGEDETLAWCKRVRLARL